MPPTPLNSGSTIEAAHGSSRFVIIGSAIVGVVALAALAYVYLATIQAPAPVATEPPTIGIIYLRPHTAAVQGFKDAMAELGYTDVVYDEAMATPGASMYPEIEAATARMLDEGVDLLWVTQEHQAEVALRVTKERGVDTPVVFLSRFHDPVEYGLVASYRSSGNNMTGVATNVSELIQRSLTFVRDMNPDAKKVGAFTTGFATPVIADAFLQELREQAARLGFEFVEFTFDGKPPEAEAGWHAAAAKIQAGDIDALFHAAGHFYAGQTNPEYQLAKRLGIPHIVPAEDLAEGGHFSYTDDYTESAKQTAVMVDKILRGASPSDIPIEYGSKNVLFLNLERAAETGIEFTEQMTFIAEDR